MTTIALIGFGKVGQTLLQTIKEVPAFRDRFRIVSVWNRSDRVFAEIDLPPGVRICERLDDLYDQLAHIDLVVECAHPAVLSEHAAPILEKADLFVSSPTAFANVAVRTSIAQKLTAGKHRCYLPLGASVGIWDVIRLDRDNQLHQLSITMKKHPDAFKISDPAVVEQIERARTTDGPVQILRADVETVNRLAPQNTNTMAIYALAASNLGFANCTGTLVADRQSESHIVDLRLETVSGLRLHLSRDNPSAPAAVTGSATFGSFLESLYRYREGIRHGHFTFC